MSEYFTITGYWKNDKSRLENYRVTSSNDINYHEDDGIFYYGVTECDLKQAIQDGDKTDLEFVIISYEPLIK